MYSRNHDARLGQILAGAILIAFGLVLTMRYLPGWAAVAHWWPVLLILGGVTLWITDMTQARR